jgi:hypothetical protein
MPVALLRRAKTKLKQFHRRLGCLHVPAALIRKLQMELDCPQAYCFERSGMHNFTRCFLGLLPIGGELYRVSNDCEPTQQQEGGSETALTDPTLSETVFDKHVPIHSPIRHAPQICAESAPKPNASPWRAPRKPTANLKRDGHMVWVAFVSDTFKSLRAHQRLEAAAPPLKGRSCDRHFGMDWGRRLGRVNRANRNQAPNLQHPGAMCKSRCECTRA